MRPAELLSDVAARHGGRARWRDLDRIDVDFSTGGLAFAARGVKQSLVTGIRARFSPHACAASFTRFGPSRMQGRFTPDRILLKDHNSYALLDRPNPRNRFTSPLRQLLWDEGDTFYFVAYAMWNYICFPFWLSSPGVELVSVTPWRQSGWRLDVRIADSIPTHSRCQRFYFDAGLNLSLHVYRADVIGWYARAVHQCFDYQSCDGFALSRRRRVVPRAMGDISFPGPTLVWIDIQKVQYLARRDAETTKEAGAK